MIGVLVGDSASLRHCPIIRGNAVAPSNDVKTQKVPIRSVGIVTNKKRRNHFGCAVQQFLI